MPQCLFPKHGVSIHTDGRISPCCSWRETDRNTATYVGKHDWQIRHKTIDKELQDKWLPGCIECEEGEKYNNRSLRTDSFKIFNNESSGIEYWDFKLNVTCNLACKMCGAHSSSAWIRDIKNNPELKDTVWSVGINKPRVWKEADGLKIEELYPELINAKYIKFTGGEPLLIPEVKKCIEFLVDNEAASAIHLQLITNGTQDLVAWNHLFKEFKHVIISVSVDAIEDLYEYIRQYASWKIVSNNILEFNKQRHKNTSLTLNYLPMAININAEEEVSQWCKENNLNMFVGSPCVNPPFMSPTALTDPLLKTELIQHLEMLDRVHGTDYKKVCSHLVDNNE